MLNSKDLTGQDMQKDYQNLVNNKIIGIRKHLQDNIIWKEWDLQDG